MSWKEEYADKICTAQEAVSKIKSGDRVVLGHAVGEPTTLSKALVENYLAYEDVAIYHFVSMGKSEYCNPGMEGHLYHNGFFLGSTTRKAIKEGRGLYTPTFLKDSPAVFRDEVKPDVILCQVSAPDEDGYCSFGVSVDYTKPAAECAKMIIAEVNEQYPVTYGDTKIHISKIDWMVPTDLPVLTLPRVKISDVELAIGQNCAALIEDGSTLQLGIGGIPDAVLISLADKKDLGIHTEMLPSGVVDLVKKGVINGKRKTLHPGKMVATFLMGTKELYDFCDGNPMVEMYDTAYTNDPFIIAQNEKMVAINSCIQVDFTGQVCAESIGPDQFSGTGGQADFFRGASASKGGKAIVAMTSTASKGTISRIVPFLDQGAVVTSTRNDYQYVVTEYGAAYLRGKSTRDRARALIAIAHPKFHDEFAAKFEEIFKCKY